MASPVALTILALRFAKRSRAEMPRADRYGFQTMRCLAFSLLAGHALGYRHASTPPGATGTRSFLTPIKVEHFGIWDRSNAVNLHDFPHVRGKGESVRWADLEPKPGQFTFTAFDKALMEAGEKNAGFYCMVHAGPDAPQWIYEEHPRVPKVNLTNVDSSGKHDKMHASGFPFYLCHTYQKHFFNMISALGKYLRSHKYAANINFVQTNYGCTGDAVLYKGTPADPKYFISEEDETKFMKATWMKYKEAFQTGPGPIIPLLVNVGQGDREKGSDAEQFAIENISPLGIKGSAWARGHHLSGERTWIEKYRTHMLNPKEGSPTPFLFTRTEMDQTWKKPLYQLNVKLGFYWGVLNALNQGLSYFDVSKDALKHAEYIGVLDSLLFFNKYAGQIWPHNSTGAFIALHLGLDAADQEKFPIKKYGRKDVERLQNICEEYEDFGCQLDDIHAATKGQVYQRDKQEGYNDVGFDIWPTNYARWLEQIDADETSQGLFRIGGPLDEDSSKYARFARGLRHTKGKTGMYFKFHDDFFRERPVGALAFRIVWYDAEPGSWQLDYKSKEGIRKVALDQITFGDGRWHEAVVNILDAQMDHSHTRGSDFALSSKDHTDAVFHMIEATRLH